MARRGRKRRREEREREDEGESSRAPSDPVFEDESPLETAADIDELWTVRVYRVAGAFGLGWRGNTYRGRPVSMGAVGRFSKTADLYERVQLSAGGGLFRFIGKRMNGRPLVVDVTLPGAPRPLPDNPGFVVPVQPPAEKVPLAAPGVRGWVWPAPLGRWVWMGPGPCPGPPPGG